MVLGIAEDFSSTVQLDSQLKTKPTSGLYVNSGVHPSINVDNLLAFLPNLNYTFTNWSGSKTYKPFLDTRDASNVVVYNNKMYQCIKENTNEQPPEAEFWVETNLESLKLKIFLESVKDRVYSDLALTKRLVNNQYIYEVGDIAKTLPNDYAAWVIEPKGSDYVSIRINEVSLQKDGTTPVNLYVINQNELLKTITITPNNGKVSFQKTDIVFSGKGQFLLAINSTDVYTGHATIDPLKFDGFVAYTALGTGDAPETADYTYNTFGNGLGINLTAYLDSTAYIDNNLSEFGNYIRATFEYMVFTMYLHNSNARSNRQQRIQLDEQILIAELKDMKSDTVVARYHREKKRAIAAMKKTFDTQLNDHDGIEITIGSV